MLHHRRQHRRAGGVSAHADHHVRREFIQHPSCIPDGARKVEGRFQASSQADIFQRAYADELQGKSRGGNQAVLDATRGSYEQNFRVVTFFQLIGDGQGGNDMSAGAAARQNCTHASDYKLQLSGNRDITLQTDYRFQISD